MQRLAWFGLTVVADFKRLLVDERAATAIEYAMIAAGAGAAIAATVYSLGTQVKEQLFQKASDMFN